MDGDEQGSCGTAVCDAGTGDEAVASGDVAPAPVDGELTSWESAEGVTAADASAETGPGRDGSAPDGSVPDDSAPDDMSPDGSSPELDDSAANDPLPDDSEPGEPARAEDRGPAADEAEVVQPEGVEVAAPADPATDVELVTRTRRLRPYLRRGALALVAAGFVAVGVGAFAWIAPSPEAANRRFVEAAESKGHVVVPGEQESLVVSAARKICDRRVGHETDRERRATALTSDEIAAVGAAFGAETRDFTTLALKTYCGS